MIIIGASMLYVQRVLLYKGPVGKGFTQSCKFKILGPNSKYVIGLPIRHCAT